MIRKGFAGRVESFYKWFLANEKEWGELGGRYSTYTSSENKNKDLFKRLETLGIWDFQVGNTKHQIIKRSQIISFCTEGYRWLMAGLTMEGHEIDHLDGNPKNDSPENLKILSKADHGLCTQMQLGFFTSYQYVEFDYSKDKQPTLANRKGERIKDTGNFLTHYIAQKLEAMEKLVRGGEVHLMERISNREEVGFYNFFEKVKRFIKGLTIKSEVNWITIHKPGGAIKKAFGVATKLWIQLDKSINKGVSLYA